MTQNGRRVALILAIVIAAMFPRSVRAQSSPTADILIALKDSILRGGAVTRLVAAPRRTYQRQPRKDALPALGALLGLAVSRGVQQPLSCPWAPVDPSSIGMDLTVTEFSVIGDSAEVSILWRCQQRHRDRTTGFESEPTWFLRRQSGRWVVVRTWMRVTVHPAGRMQRVG